MGCVGEEGVDDDLALRDFHNDHANNTLDREGGVVDRYQNKRPDNLEHMFEVEEQAGGQEFMALKPWIGALKAPSNPPAFKKGPPSVKLQISFVNGYRTEDTRSNLYFLDSNTLLFPAACLGITMNITTRKQAFYGGGVAKDNKKHKDDILSLALDPNRKLVATGSLGARPQIFIWNAQSKETVGQFNLGRNTRAVAVICFSPDSKFVFLGDKADQHNVYVYSVSGALVAQAKTGSDNLNDCAAGNNSFATVSKDGFLNFGFNGSSLEKRRGTFSGNEPSPLTSVAHWDNIFYAGGLNGMLYIFEGSSCTKAIKAHQKALMAVAAFSDCIITSGSDNVLKVMGRDLVTQRSISMTSYCKAIDKLGSDIVCGTRLGQIYVIKPDDQKTEVMKTHWSGQVWGLAICPKTGFILTAGDDNDILAFDLKLSKVVSRGVVSTIPGVRKKIGGASTLSLLPPNQQSRAIAVSKKTGNVVLATNVGGISVRSSASTLDDVVFQNLKLANEWIQVMKFDPKGEKLAVGSHDNNIYVLGQNFQQLCVLKAHNSFITNLDWSVDGTKIQSNCGAYEYLFFDVNSGKQLTGGATQLKDQAWHTYSVKLGWYVQGIFPPTTSGDFINSCIRSYGGDKILTGDDFGNLNIFENPALKGAVPISYKAHSSHVVRALWEKGDGKIFSVGGFDKSLIIWKKS